MTRISLCLLLVVAFAFPLMGDATVRLNEVMASNAATAADEDGDFEDWVELYNTGDAPVLLEGYGLSDDYDRPYRWTLPSVTLEPGAFLLVFASGKDRRDPGGELHTNFSIGAGGEEVLLTSPHGLRVDELAPTPIPTDVSFGRQPDGTGDWFYFAQPTPGTANVTAPYTDILGPPQLSHQSGFYTEPFELEMDAGPEGTSVRYTLDGSAPTASSPLYTGPITVADRDGEPNTISMIPTAIPAFSWQEPVGSVRKATVIRAGAFKEGAMASDPVTATYFVGPGINERYQVPVISLVTGPRNLFDDAIGIYVPGDLYEDLFPDKPWQNPANYLERGSEWERHAHVTLFEPGGAPGLIRDAGVRIHGGATTRSFPQKSLRLYADPEYGDTPFEYPLFGAHNPDAFTYFLLRNSGDDNPRTMFRDGMLQSLAQDLPLDRQAYRPSVVFINGEYWGVHNIRERIDNYHLHHHHGVDPGNLDILTGDREVKEGDAAHYDGMLSYIEQNDMALLEHYRHVQTLMDTDNFAAYQAFQIYIGNTDWPNNNIDYWRLRAEQYEPEAPWGHDGRWRWLLFDTDFGFGGNGASWDHNTLAWATRLAPAWSTFLFSALLENEEFRIGFVNHLADQMNTILHPYHVVETIEAKRDEMAPLMQEHIDRWRRHASVEEWHDHVDDTVAFAIERPAHVRQHIIDQFGLGGLAVVTLDVTEGAGGSVRVNTVEVSDGTPGSAGHGAPYPWSGAYFQGIPVEIEAVPAPGYVFSHWEGLSAGTPPRTSVELTGDMTLTAHFEELPPVHLLHCWHFNDLPEGTLETVNADASLLGGAGISYTGAGEGYMDRVDDGTALNARLGEAEGNALRVRNPSDTRELVLTLPTTAHEDIVLRYAVKRTTNGATEQQVQYRAGPGAAWTPFGGLVAVTEEYAVAEFDFAGVAGVDDNPEFAVRILFGGPEAAGDSGNNRFDNITVEGVPVEGANRPPVLARPLEFEQVAENGAPLVIDLNTVFEDPDGGPLSYGFGIDNPAVADVALSGSQLTVTPLLRGGATVELWASDGFYVPVETAFRVLVHPEAFPLRDGVFTFDAWDPGHPEGAYPEHMLFLQSGVGDPVVDTPLRHPYLVPHDDYHDDDVDTVGFPYNNTRRTRLNGLGDSGISFINTGRDRDLGGALAAFDTTGLGAGTVSWVAGTILPNERIQGLRLQYRTSLDAPFHDVMALGAPVEYIRSEVEGDDLAIGPVALPADAMDQKYVQLLWRYHHIGVDSGARAELRLDDIRVALSAGTVQVTILPEAVAAAGAQWRIDGGTWRDSGAVAADLLPGSYTVSFSDVDGWVTPPDQTVSIVADETVALTVAYLEAVETGSLTVDISPEEAVTAGARWRLVGTGDWRESGYTETGLAVGNHAVEFSDVAGWVAPGALNVAVDADEDARRAVTYQRVTPDPGPGTGGGGCRKAATHMKELGLECPVYETALPARRDDDGVRLAASGAPLAVRLRAREPIDPESVRGLVAWSGNASGDVSRVQVVDGYGTDLWVVFAPETPWPPGELVTFIAAAATFHGDAVGPAEFSFLVTDTGQSGVNALTLALDVPHFADSAGPAWRIVPDALFDEPVTVHVPVPRGRRASELEVAYHHQTEEGRSALVPVELVEGWLAPGSVQVISDAEGQWFELTVNHGATVQVRERQAPRALAGHAFQLPGSGELLVCLLMAGALGLAPLKARHRRRR